MKLKREVLTHEDVETIKENILYEKSKCDSILKSKGRNLNQGDIVLLVNSAKKLSHYKKILKKSKGAL